jgi:phospholipase C
MRLSQFRRSLLACVTASALLVTTTTTPVLAAAMRGNTKATMLALAANDANTRTPIQHVIIIVGENRSYDHLFATYVPPKGSTMNLLSEGIIKADGSAGPNVQLATQFKASDTTTFSISPTITNPYKTLPTPTTGFVHENPSDTNPPPFATVAAAAQFDHAIPDNDLVELTTGATGLPFKSPDTRIANVTSLPNAPFELTGLYDAYMNSPIHRFFQAWQQGDCSAAYATATNPSGCRNDLFPWVEITAGFNEGSTAQGFYNVQKGDASYFTWLANTYSMADNYHQPVRGGTGANSIMLGFGDLLYYSDGHGNPTTPPAAQIENPNPKPGTNNHYTDDGYSAGSYVNCADDAQPGVDSIRSYLAALPWHPAPNCENDAYYLVNNYNPGYKGDGSLDTSEFTIPPVITRSIGDNLNDHQVSWAYYGEHWNAYLAGQPNAYCNICNPFQYQTQVMTDPVQRTKHLKDTDDLYNALALGRIPAVSFVKPSGLNDGHPASSKFDIFEAFVQKILDMVHANPKLYNNTAVFITTDEAGGYWDTGYTHTLDFFGDGNRIPLIVVSRYSEGVGVVHSYTDHVSLLKFIEKNWSLPPISSRSRDNLPNPQTAPGNPYVPVNGAAIGDLMDFFNFKK